MFSSDTRTLGTACPPPLKSLESNSNGDLVPESTNGATLGLRSITSVFLILS